MFIQKRVYFIISFIMIFSGCTLTTSNKNTAIIPKEQTIIIEKPIIKKPIKVKKSPIKKKKITYKFCSKHLTIMSHASKYIKEEFDKGYFIQKDIIGAKAQLFLIESKSTSLFAKNINNAINSYNTQYKLAKKNKCNLSNFKITPIQRVKRKIKTLEKKESKK